MPPVAARRLKIADARSDFLSTGDVRDIPVALAASWQRSASAGVDAATARAGYHDGLDVFGRLARCAQRVIDRLLDETVGMPLSIVLTDSKARILSRSDTDRRIGARMDSVSLSPGFGYAEGSIGTNGIGTVCEAGRPAFIVGPEHFHELLQPFACAGSPIRDPLTGRVEGVLDVSCLVKDSSPLMVSLVATAAHDIERSLLLDRSRAQQAIFETFIRLDARTRAAVMAVGDAVVMANAMTHSMFDPAEQGTITEHARGLMVRRDSPVAQVELGSGKVVRLRGTRIVDGGNTAGIVIAVDILAEGRHRRVVVPPSATAMTAATDVARTQPSDAVAGDLPDLPAPRRPLVQIVDDHSPLWQRATDSIAAALAGGGALLVMGERGSGKATLVADVHSRLHPGGRSVVVEACDLVQSARGVARQRAGPGSLLYLFKNVDRLTARGVEGLDAILDGLAGRDDTARVVATMDDAVRDSDQPFRELLGRFHTAVTVPPLRHRSSDLPELAKAVLGRLVPGRPVTVGPAAMRVLSRFTWPQNILQLESALAAALQQRPVGEIQVEDLPGYCHTAARRQLFGMEAMERDLIVSALRAADGNRVHAAAALGIARSSLYRKLKSFGITTV